MTGPLIRPLTTPAELASVLEEVTVLDVRYQLGGPTGAGEFEEGHIPGAAYVDLDRALAAEPGERGRHPLPEPAVFEAAMREAGVSRRRPVVVYDDWQGRAAARCWWLLRFHGHLDVRVLDGGLASWLRHGGEVETGTTAPAQGDFVAEPGRARMLLAEDVLSFAIAGVLIDARNPERYRGETEPIDPVAGHIPGAVNVPTGANVARDGTFKSLEELREIYARALEGEVGAYCGSGVTACHDVLALATIGVDAALYPGSWSEWVTDPERPVATG